MREIEFRGWAIKEQRWVYGSYEDYMVAFGPHTATIHVKMDWGLNGSFEVDPDSVGQFTGEHDKNENKIFEDDIISDGLFQRLVTYGRTGFLAGEDDLYQYIDEPYEVIGNKYEKKKTPIKES